MVESKENHGFLQAIAARFLAQYPQNPHQVAFVFPTRRAGLFFKHHLQQGISHAEWAPAILSINDFMIKQSKLRCAETLELVVELYQIFSSTVTSFPKNFEEFYPWGKMILSDFNEIDKFLVDINILFRSLSEFGEIEKLDIGEKTPIYQRYVGFWKELNTIYDHLGQLLRSKNKAYEGMIYRDVAEGRGDIRPLPWEKVIFAGFNALTPCEEKLFQTLIQTGRGEVLWDMDTYFVEDENQEAGHFFRRNRQHFSPSNMGCWVDQKLLTEKTIRVRGVQSKVSQTKVLASLLKEVYGQGVDPRDVVVVLPDESLLFPVLNSIPSEIKSINVTMGYPLDQTPVHSLFTTLVTIQKNMKPGGCNHQDVMRLLNHPYVKHLYSEQIPPFIYQLKRDNQLLVPDIPFLTAEFAVFINRAHPPRRLIDHFLSLLAFIRTQYEADPGGFLRIDMEFLLGFYRLLQQLSTAMERFGLQLDISTFWQLFNDIAASTRLPFSGEPLQGLQVMGMLETQCLDFKQVIILSLNEGFLPVGKVYNSFIPRDIRRFVNLPIYREHDAMSAYHFYRLLRHARQVDLVYVESGGQGGGFAPGERSRFVDQILLEYQERNPHAEISQQVCGFNFALQPVRSISIEKSAADIEQMLEHSFSASSILTYLHCSLRFYYQYLIGLKEDEELFSSPDRRLMGNIIHKALEKMYRPHINRVMAADEISELAADGNIERYLRAAFKEETALDEIDTGRNRIIYEVMKRMIEYFLEHERSMAGFKLLHVERRVELDHLIIPVAGKQRKLKLKGIIDRIDLKDGVLRIIDYKTGDVGSLNLPALDRWPVGEVIKKKAAFQLLFYWYMAVNQFNDISLCQLAVYPFKTFTQPLLSLCIDKDPQVGRHHLDDFETLLSDIFTEMLSPDELFSQAVDEARCRNCPFTKICMRGI